LTPGKPLRIYVAGGSRSASGKSHSKGRKNPVPVGKVTGPTKAASGTGEAVAAPKATTRQLAEGR
jgi:hypothetical protein